MNKKEFVKAVVDTYNATYSVRATAKEIGCSWNRIVKVLSTEGVAVSDKHEKILELYSEGKTPQEIADVMGTSRAAVMNFLPATRPIYRVGQSQNAKVIKKWRLGKNK